MQNKRLKKRSISSEMLNSFLKGELKPLLDAVKMDDTLDMELRGDFVNIYYRGGSLFKIVQMKTGYQIDFNLKYCVDSFVKLEKNPSVDNAVKNIPFYKQAMDKWFHFHPKYEREFQQVIARENNNLGKISKSTDYFIVDIEYANSIKTDKKDKKSADARFDMVALKWLSNGAARKNSKKVSLALIEVKFGSGALKGKAGVTKHITDFHNFFSDEKTLKAFCEDMSLVFKQKCQLGIIDGLKEYQYNVEIDHKNAEVIFIFANHDPDSEILETVLNSQELKECSFPVMVAKSSSMGYCLYADQLECINQ